MDNMDTLMAIIKSPHKSPPPHSPYHCGVDIMDILMAISCHGAIKSPPHRELKFPVELLYHCAMDIMDILTAIIKSPHKSPPHSLYHCVVDITDILMAIIPQRCIPCQPIRLNTTSI